MEVRLYFHVHTRCSKDALITIKQIENFLKVNKNAILVITDHNTSLCAEYLKKKFPHRIIIGVEMETTEGDIIGFFIKNYENTRHPLKFIKSVKKNGGLICIPHPKFFNGRIENYLRYIDFIEVFNARRGYYNVGNIKNVKKICGCDAHSIQELNTCYISIDVNSLNEDEIKRELLRGNFRLVIRHRVPRPRMILTFILTIHRTRNFSRILKFILKRINVVL